MRHRKILLAVPVCATAMALMPVAARAEVIPAPPGHAEGVAARVGSLLDISKTGATADSGAPSAEASVVRLGDQPLLGLGGTQSGDGASGGSLADTGATLPARVQVAPWRASADGTHTATRHAQSSAAVARADVPAVARAGVLTSDSDASHTDQKSTGTAVTDGVQLTAPDIAQLVLLHSEVSTEGRGHSYLVGLNGTELGTDEQLGASPLCALDAAGVASLSCLTASGGAGAGSPVAQVAELTPALEALAAVNPVAGFTATATAGSGTPALTAAPAATPVVAAEAARAAAPEPAASAPTAVEGRALARTGAAIASLAGAAVGLLAMGFALRRLRPAVRPS
jgi:pilus assembly protein FimV